MEYAPADIRDRSPETPDPPAPHGPQGPVTAIVFNDPGCPFGYSANPALRTLEWRYRDQIVWHLVTIGLSDPDNPSGFGIAEQAASWIHFRDRYGMPFSAEPKSREFTTSRACQAITASRLLHPGSEWRVLRTLQLLHFNSPLLLDDDSHLAAALDTVPGIDAAAVIAAIDSEEARDAYRSDWTRSREAGTGPAWLQLKTAESPEGPRYTAPSVIFSHGGRHLEIGGFQPIEAYDAAVANLNPGLNRVGPAGDPVQALRLYRTGLATQEIAAIMAGNLDSPDRSETERELTGLLAEGRVKRVPLGNDALWLAA